MATVAQIYQLVNDAAKEALGSKAIAVKDTTLITADIFKKLGAAISKS